MDKKQFKEEIRTKSIQYSYTIEGLGRVHIRQTGQTITGIRIDDSVEYAFDGAQVLQSDYIIKTGVQIMQYVRGEVFNIAVPNVMYAEGGDEDVIAAVMQLGYATSAPLKQVAKSSRTLKRIMAEQCMDIIVPFHRVEFKGEPEYCERLRQIEKNNEAKYYEFLKQFVAIVNTYHGKTGFGLYKIPDLV